MVLEKERAPFALCASAAKARQVATPSAPGARADVTTTDGRLRRTLRLRDAVVVGVGGTIGGGIFVLIGTAAALAGPGALLSFVVAFLASVVIALPYAELAARYPRAGGGYAIVQAVLGQSWGFLLGWGYWGAWIFASGYVTLGVGGYLEALSGMPTRVGALLVIALVCVANLGGARLAGGVQLGLVGLATAGLAGFAAAGLPSLRLDHFSPFLPYGAGGVLAGALPAFLAFGGFDMVATAGEEIADAERTLPRAILLTLGIVVGLYLLVTAVAISVVGWHELGNSTAPLSAAAGRFGGSLGERTMAIVALVTMAATANAVLLASSRVAFAMARDGLLPAIMAQVDGRTGVPGNAVRVSAGLFALNAAVGSVAFAAATGGFLYVLHFLLPLLALAIARRRDGALARFGTPGVQYVLPAAFVLCLILLVASGWGGALVGGGWLVVGLVARRGVVIRG